jgi:hypothetical protein
MPLAIDRLGRSTASGFSANVHPPDVHGGVPARTARTRVRRGTEHHDRVRRDADCGRVARCRSPTVNLKVDVILASGTPPVPVAKNATKTVPIVFVASIDPVAAGVAASLPRPGRNITGLSGVHSELMGKRLELLGEAVPKLSRLAVLSHATNPGNAEYIKQAERAAKRSVSTSSFLRSVTPVISSVSSARPEAQTP